MTIDRTTAETLPGLALQEIHVTQGDYVAKIDLIFFDEPALLKKKQECDNAIFDKCQEEN
jgi:hypothetical protein